MARDARIEQQWTHTASLEALIANCHRSKNQQPYDVYHFHPYLKRPPRTMTVDELRELFGTSNGNRGSD